MASRRKFLIRAGIGTGLLFGTVYCLPVRRKIAEQVNVTESPYVGSTDDPKIWFEVTPDNQILLHSPKMEMGQGVFTGLAQIAADELEIGIEQMKVVHASTASGNVDAFATGGSTSISRKVCYVRRSSRCGNRMGDSRYPGAERPEDL